MSAYAMKPRFRRSLRDVERRVVAAGISADAITGAGFVCACAAAACVMLSGASPLWLMAVPPLVLLRLTCNALDGMVAADTGRARPLGTVFNEFSDRVADCAILVAVAVESRQLLLGMGAVALMLLSSYLGTVAAAAGGSRQYNGVMGKADRMLLLVPVSIAAVFVGTASTLMGYLVVVALGCVVTIWQRARAIHSELSSR